MEVVYSSSIYFGFVTDGQEIKFSILEKFVVIIFSF